VKKKKEEEEKKRRRKKKCNLKINTVIQYKDETKLTHKPRIK
jgi:hypothetical protein